MNVAANSEHAPLRASNGHHLEKSGGNTVYGGPLTTLPPPTWRTVEDAAAQMYTHGYVIFPGALSRAEAAALRALMDEKGGDDDTKWDVPHWCYNRHQVTDYWQDPRLLTYIDRPGIIDVVQAIQGSNAHVTGGSFWTTGHGRAMGIHVDFLPVSLPETVHNDSSIQVPIFTSTLHFYLNDMTEELGPTTIIPGSHRAGRPPCDETAWHGIVPQAVMVNAGDACLFRGDIWHGSGMNSCHTDHRYMMQVHYGHEIIRKQYPPMQYASFWNPKVTALATPQQRQLLGDSQ